MSILARVIMLAALTIALGVSAQETIRVNAAEKPNKETPQPKPAAAAASPEKPAAESKPAAPADAKKSTAADTPDHFEPTEKVRADFDVSFPVDI